MIRILDVGASYGYDVARIFRPWVMAGKAQVIVDPSWTHKADLICFGGGADVNPEKYGQKNVASGVSFYSKLRDEDELDLFRRSVDLKVPILGICRGSQLTCVASGGALIQHVEGHGQSHDIKTNDGRSFYVTSTHHQMQYPGSTPHELIAWAAPKRSDVYLHNIADFKVPELEPEIVFYPETKALAVQGHPEYLAPTDKWVKYVRELIGKYLFGAQVDE